MSAQPKAGRRLPFYFSPGPDEAREAIARGEIGERAYAILGWLLRSMLAAGYAPGRECTKEKIRAAFHREGPARGWSLRNIQRALGELKKAGFVDHLPDPADVTGQRIVFPFLAGPLRIARVGAEPDPPGPRGDEFVSPGETSLSPPPRPPGRRVCLPRGDEFVSPPHLLDARARSETGTIDRNNVNVGFAGRGTEAPARVPDGDATAEAPARAEALGSSDAGSEGDAAATTAARESPRPEACESPQADLSDEELEDAVRKLDVRLQGRLSSIERGQLKLERSWLIGRRKRDRRPDAAGDAGPARPPGPPAAPAPTPRPDFDTLMRRLLPGSSFGEDVVQEAAARIAKRLRDDHSIAFWRIVCGQVRSGDLPLRELARALRKAGSGTAENPAAVAASHIRSIRC